MKPHVSGFVELLLGMMLLVACEDRPIINGVGHPSVDVVPDTATLVTTPPANTRQFTAVVNNLSNTAVIWRSTVPTAATVSTTGLVTALALGSTQIIAISRADTLTRGAALVNVVVFASSSSIQR
jgi:uncharacterized protein YjdB